MVIQTVDFFPPIVDDPYLYGQIAAANALSDIYAMGAAPSLAMNLLCYPSCLPLEVVGEILRGGADKVREAGAVLAGGHTIDDPEPKYGLCVTGFSHPDAVLANSTAKVGDILVLTKPLGIGILTTAAKGGLLSEGGYCTVTGVMATLNKAARDAMVKVGGAHACTDVTGFGLLGHSYEMATGSGVTIRLFARELPTLPQALDFAAMGLVPAGAYQNAAYLKGRTLLAPELSTAMGDLLTDPQTSGGLLIAMDPQRVEAYLQELAPETGWAAVVGEVVPPGEHPVVVLG